MAQPASGRIPAPAPAPAGAVAATVAASILVGRGGAIGCGAATRALEFGALSLLFSRFELFDPLLQQPDLVEQLLGRRRRGLGKSRHRQRQGDDCSSQRQGRATRQGSPLSALHVGPISGPMAVESLRLGEGFLAPTAN